MVREFSNSVRIISVDLAAVERALADYVTALHERPEVLEVVLFGSFATGRYAPGSDVDLLLVVSDSPLSAWQRAVAYLPERFPVGVDLFVYTVAELEQSGFAQAAMREGKVLWRRATRPSPGGV